MRHHLRTPFLASPAVVITPSPTETGSSPNFSPGCPPQPPFPRCGSVSGNCPTRAVPQVRATPAPVAGDGAVPCLGGLAGSSAPALLRCRALSLVIVRRAASRLAELAGLRHGSVDRWAERDLLLLVAATVQTVRSESLQRRLGFVSGLPQFVLRHLTRVAANQALPANFEPRLHPHAAF